MRSLGGAGNEPAPESKPRRRASLTFAPLVFPHVGYARTNRCFSAEFRHSTRYLAAPNKPGTIKLRSNIEISAFIASA